MDYGCNPATPTETIQNPVNQGFVFLKNSKNLQNSRLSETYSVTCFNIRFAQPPYLLIFFVPSSRGTRIRTKNRIQKVKE